MILDTIVLLAAFLAIVFAAAAADIDFAGRLAVVAVFGLLLLYEPLLLWRYGATLGHRWANLRVVAESTGGHPAFATAFVRFVVKAVLGLPSFILMALTRQHQALHDRIAGTTVRIRDLDRARDLDVAWERTDVELAPPGMPSWVRRLVVIVIYVALSFLVLVLLSVGLVSQDCIMTETCTSGENLRLDIAGLVWLAVVALCIIAGWRGKLFGARRVRPEAEVSAEGWTEG